MKPTARLLLPLVLASIAAGCGRGSGGGGADEAKPAVPSVQVAVARSGSIEVTLPATGTLAAPRNREATVSAPVAAVLDGVFVKVGDHVTAGQTIAHLSTRALEGQIQQAQATLAQNRVQVAQAIANATQQQAQSRTAILQAQAAVAAAQANHASAQATLVGDEAAVSNARQSLARLQSLLADGIVAGKDVEAAQLALNTAVSVRDAQKEAVRAAAATLESQRQQVAAARAASLQDVVKRQDVAVAREQMRSTAGLIATDQAQLALYTVRSPLTGIVTAVGSSPGETVDTTTKIATITDLSLLQLQIAVPAERQRDVHPGEVVRFDVLGRSLSATIARVGSQVDPVSNTVTAVANVPNPAMSIKDDTIVQGQIRLAQHDGATIIPRAALLETPGAPPTVMVVGDDSKVHERKVTVGLRNDREVEILSGVRPGDRVATVGAYGLADGAEVSVPPAGDAGHQGAP